MKPEEYLQMIVSEPIMLPDHQRPAGLFGIQPIAMEMENCDLISNMLVKHPVPLNVKAK